MGEARGVQERSTGGRVLRLHGGGLGLHFHGSLSGRHPGVAGRADLAAAVAASAFPRPAAPPLGGSRRSNPGLRQPPPSLRAVAPGEEDRKESQIEPGGVRARDIGSFTWITLPDRPDLFRRSREGGSHGWAGWPRRWVPKTPGPYPVMGLANIEGDPAIDHFVWATIRNSEGTFGRPDFSRIHQIYDF